MKRILLFPLLGWLMLGCSEGPSEAGGSQDEKPAEAVAGSYLSINVVSAVKASGRADGDYKDGETYENSVSLVRFFFFGNDGSAVAVAQDELTGESLSYVDYRPTAADEGGKDENMTVEKIVKATLGINVSDDSSLPTQVVAVLNPSAAVLALTGSPSMTELRAKVSDFRTGLTGQQNEGGFVMSNTVYVDDGTVTDTQLLLPENFGLNAAEAEAHPVIIFVERVLARLDLTINLQSETLTDGTVAYKPENADKGGDGEEIYVKFLGWNIVGTPDRSRLIKKVSPQWDTYIFGDVLEPWNAAIYRRSFWAINPAADEFDYLYGSFNGNPDAAVGNYCPATALPIPAPGAYATGYMQENAATLTTDLQPDGPAYPSKVILAAQLVDADGKKIQLAHWGAKKYSIGGVRTALANALDLYKKRTSDTETVYTKIEAADLTFATASEVLGDAAAAESGRYNSYAVLAPAAEAAVWTLGNKADAEVFESVAEINKYIRGAVGPVMVWTDGYAYYYFDIRHLGATGFPGYYGVVRNHIYDAVVNRLSGLGTPVYDPGEVIYPSMPEYDKSVVAAEVQILQWRIVSQEYELTW